MPLGRGMDVKGLDFAIRALVGIVATASKQASTTAHKGGQLEEYTRQCRKPDKPETQNAKHKIRKDLRISSFFAKKAQILLVMASASFSGKAEN